MKKEQKNLYKKHTTSKGGTQMSKKERQAYKRGATEMLLSITAMGTWIVMFIAYGYMKFM